MMSRARSRSPFEQRNRTTLRSMVSDAAQTEPKTLVTVPPEGPVPSLIPIRIVFVGWTAAHLFKTLPPGPKRQVPKSLRRRLRRYIADPAIHLVKHANQCTDMLRCKFPSLAGIQVRKWKRTSLGSGPSKGRVTPNTASLSR